MQSTRVCRTCQNEKPLDAFYNCKSCKGRKDYICAQCRQADKAERASSPSGLYESKSRILTTAMKLVWFPNQEYHEQVDHIFSIRAGYEYAVPLAIINNRNNLRLMPKWANIKKGSRSDMTLEQLYATAEPNTRLERLANILEPITDPAQLTKYNILATYWYKAHKITPEFPSYLT